VTIFQYFYSLWDFVEYSWYFHSFSLILVICVFIFLMHNISRGIYLKIPFFFYLPTRYYVLADGLPFSKKNVRSVRTRWIHVLLCDCSVLTKFFSVPFFIDDRSSFLRLVRAHGYFAVYVTVVVYNGGVPTLTIQRHFNYVMLDGSTLGPGQMHNIL